jgi:NarL family two-component system response regulator LiaR
MISISIIEDHDQYRKSLEDIVNQNPNFKINDVYSSAEEAIVSIVDNPPDIAIVDIKLKTISGIEFIETTRSKIPNTQFLMCTAYQNNENVFNALKAGALGYIIKDSSVDEIQNAITELYNGGAPMSPYIARKVINLLHQKEEPKNYNLSDRELEVLSLLSKGLLYKEISDKLGITSNTVKNHCKNIYKRLHVQNKVEAINKYRSL